MMLRIDIEQILPALSVAGLFRESPVLSPNNQR